MQLSIFPLNPLSLPPIINYHYTFNMFFLFKNKKSHISVTLYKFSSFSNIQHYGSYVGFSSVMSANARTQAKPFTTVLFDFSNCIFLMGLVSFAFSIRLDIHDFSIPVVSEVTTDSPAS